MQEIAYVIYWWLLLVFIGILSFPLVSRVCGSLGDKGYSISKIVGLLFLTYFVWILGSLHILPFGGTSILISFLVLAALSLYFGRKNLNVKNWPRKQILISEIIFAVFFAVFTVFLMKSNDIYTRNGDLFSSFAFFSSIARDGYFPPTNVWFAGSDLGYYYGGYVVMALPTIVIKVPPTISFNIAGAMFFALATTAAYGLGYNITGRKLYGLIALLFVCILGYISGAFELTSHFLNSPQGGPDPIKWMLNFECFNAREFIDGCKIYYPYLKLLTWDIHSYVMSIPFQLMFITFVFALFRGGRPGNDTTRADTLLHIVILSLGLGFFYLLNTWDYPSYVVFTLLAFVLLKIRPNPKGDLAAIASPVMRPITILSGRIKALSGVRTTILAVISKLPFMPQNSTRDNIKGTLAAALGTLAIPAVIVVLSFALFIPHYLAGTGTEMTGGISIVPAYLRTSLHEFLEFSSLFIFVVLSLLFILWKREVFSRGWKAITASVFIIVATVLPSVLLDFQVLIVVIPVGLMSLYCIYRTKPKSGLEFVLLLVITAAIVAFAAELFYLEFQAAHGLWVRKHTGMKLYMELWILLSTSAACGVFYMLNNPGRKRKIIWGTIVFILILACLIHPVATTTSLLNTDSARCWHAFRPDTLDGMAYYGDINGQRFKSDYEAIRWINQNIEGSAVILETPGIDKQFTSRVSTFTGLPTLVGWHIMQKMMKETGVWQRIFDVNTIYSTGNNSLALELLNKWNVKYIYIGYWEKATYDKAYELRGWPKQNHSSEGFRKFDDHPEDYILLYENEGTSIYELIDRAR